MAQKDPYDILGVPRSATPDDVKRAYRRLAKEYHPDRNKGDKRSEQKFKEVQAAYEVLGDPQRRAQYDRFGAGGPRPEFHNWGAGPAPDFQGVPFDFSSMGDLHSIFEQFFSREPTQRPRRRPDAAPRARGADLEHEIELSFVEAARGTTREVVLTGARGRDERIEFRVPAGVQDGQRIRVPDKGQPGPGGRGHLMIRCGVRPHPYFRRDGLDVLLDVPISLAEAAFGGPVEIPTLDGQAVVQVPPGTSSGTKLRLRGKGIRDERSNTIGDLYAVPKIVLPRHPSAHAQELLRQLGAELNQHPRLNWPG